MVLVIEHRLIKLSLGIQAYAIIATEFAAIRHELVDNLSNARVPIGIKNSPKDARDAFRDALDICERRKRRRHSIPK